MRCLARAAAAIGGVGAMLASCPLAADPAFGRGAGIQLAQAGSTGGSIGKQGKSVSGGEDAARPRRANRAQQPAPRMERRAKNPAGSAPLSGRWAWTAQCPISHHAGEFDIGPLAGGGFAGAFLTDLPGPISNGRLSGSAVSFTRTVLGMSQPWRGTLAQSGGKPQIKGSITGAFGETCTFVATKN